MTAHMKPVVGARTGTGAWLMQRASALLLALLLPLLLGHVLWALPADYAAWRAIFAPAWVRAALLLAGLALALHAWVGMRDVLMDYVRMTRMRLTLAFMVLLVLAGSVAWLVALLWSLP